MELLTTVKRGPGMAVHGSGQPHRHRTRPTYLPHLQQQQRNLRAVKLPLKRLQPVSLPLRLPLLKQVLVRQLRMVMGQGPAGAKRRTHLLPASTPGFLRALAAARYYTEYMSTDRIWRTHSTGSAASEKLAEAIGARLFGGETIELVGDLGSGKTTFVRGLARGIGSNEHVASPSFTLGKVYASKKFQLHHFDFYRLKEPGLLAHELSEMLDSPDDVIVVEWADTIREVLPQGRMIIMIRTTGESERQFTFHYPPKLAYLLEGVKR